MSFHRLKDIEASLVQGSIIATDTNGIPYYVAPGSSDYLVKIGPSGVSLLDLHAGNGIQYSGSTISLGGTLNQNTVFNGNTFNVNWNVLSHSILAQQNVSIQAANTMVLTGFSLSLNSDKIYMPQFDIINGTTGFNGKVLFIDSNYKLNYGTATTTQIVEGSNLYYLDSRARASLSAGAGISYDPVTGIITNTGGGGGGSSVVSVFNRTGVVVATTGDYNTSQVTEGSNLYFTNARARAAITLTTTGSGAATYVGGVLNIPTQAAGGVTSFNTRTGAITLTSSDVTTALAFTPYNATNPAGYISTFTETDPVARAKTITLTAGTGIAITGGAQTIGVNPTFTIASTINNNNQLANGSNYITAAAVPAQFNPIAGTNITLSGTYPNITFNGTGGVAGTNWGSIAGTLSNQVDLQTALNNKQNTLSGTGYPKFAGSTPTYIAAIPNSDLANSSITLNTHAVSLGGTLSLTGADLGIGNVLNFAQVINAGGAYSFASGLLSARPAFGTAGRFYYATDTGLEYYDSGTAWAIATGAMTGDVTRAVGSTVLTLATVNSNVGTFNNVTVNAKGQVISASNVAYLTSNAVASVFGRTGAVVAVSGDYTTSLVTEGSNLYFTNARAQAAITLTTTGTGAATYTGGVLNIPTQTAGGVTSFNTRTGAITLTSSDVTTALTFTPYNATNPAGYITAASVPAQFNPIAGTNITLTGTYPNITFTSTGGVAGTNWGSIAGTLSNQTDLQTALNAKQNSLSGTGYAKWAGTTPSYITAIPNSDLANSTITLNTHVVSLGGALFLATSDIGLGNVLNQVQVINAGGALSFASGLLSARPAFGTVGRFYYATDTGLEYYDTGTAWSVAVGATSGDVTSAVGSTVLTLATVNSNVGTFNNVTVNGKGLVTSASNVTYALDSGVVHLAGAETITGTKTHATATAVYFTSAGSNFGSIQNTSSNRWALGYNTVNTGIGTEQIWWTTTGAGVLGTFNVAGATTTQALSATTGSFTGNITALSIIKSGGNNTQILLADGTTIPTSTFATAGSGVSSVTGTANQVTVSPNTGAVVVSLPSNLTLSGGNSAGTYIGPVSIGQSAGDYSSVGYNVGFTSTAATWNYKISDYASFVRFYQGGFQFYTTTNAAPTAGSSMTATATASISNTGAITATNHIGPGTGLTGTAAGLSIGGNAATATNSTQWGGYRISGGVAANPISYLMGYDSTAGMWASVTAAQANTFLGSAVDSAVVHIAGTETITGSKTFTTQTTHNGTVALVNGSQMPLMYFLKTGVVQWNVGSDTGTPASNNFVIANGNGKVIEFSAAAGNATTIYGPTSHSSNVTITTSAAGASILDVYNSSTTGYGVSFRNGLDTNYALAIKNAASGTANIQFFGNGTASFTGSVTGFTEAIGDSSTKYATTAFVKSQNYATNAALTGYLPLAASVKENLTNNVAGDVGWSFYNSSTTGYGINIRASATPYYALAIGNPSGSANVISFFGDGTASFAGTVTGFTEAAGDNSTKYATTAFVKSQNYVTSAALTGYLPLSATTSQTISNNVAAAGWTFYNSNAAGYGVYIRPGSNTNYALSILDSTGTSNVINFNGNGTASFTGSVTGFTEASGDSSTKYATTAFVKSQNYATSAALTGYLPLNGGGSIQSLTNNIANVAWTFSNLNTSGTGARFQAASDGQWAIGVLNAAGSSYNITMYGDGRILMNGLTATTGYFNGAITSATNNAIAQLDQGTATAYLFLTNNGTRFYMAKENSASSGFNATPYANVLYATAGNLEFIMGGTRQFQLTQAGMTTLNYLTVQNSSLLSGVVTMTGGGNGGFTNYYVQPTSATNEKNWGVVTYGTSTAGTGQLAFAVRDDANTSQFNYMVVSRNGMSVTGINFVGTAVSMGTLSATGMTGTSLTVNGSTTGVAAKVSNADSTGGGVALQVQAGSASYAGLQVLNPSGSANIFMYGTGDATFNGTVTANVFLEPSDMRLKSIASRSNDMATFTWKDGRDDRTHFGYVAQEVQKKYPNQVYNQAGTLHVNYLQVHTKKINDLEGEVERLKEVIKNMGGKL